MTNALESILGMPIFDSVVGNLWTAFVAIRPKAARCVAKLGDVQLRASESPKRDVSDFAGLLAAMTKLDQKQEPGWSNEDLGQDVAILSYEDALRAHARYKRAGHVGDGIGERVEGALTQLCSSGADRDKRASAAPKPAVAQSPSVDGVPSAGQAMTQKIDRKAASITIRMSKAECEQLRRRAVEAGLTVSAYLRSCALEAEVLRAQVKKALAEIRKAEKEGTSGRVDRNAGKSRFDGASGTESLQCSINRESGMALQQNAARGKLGRVFLPVRGLGRRLFHGKLLSAGLQI